MKLSLKHKLMSIITILILGIFLLEYFFIGIFLSKYYVYKNKIKLNNIIKSLKNTDIDVDMINYLEHVHNIKINFIDSNKDENRLLFDHEKNKENKKYKVFDRFSFFSCYSLNDKEKIKNGEIIFKIVDDKKFSFKNKNLKFLTTLYYVNKEEIKYLVLISPIISLDEAADISRDFFLFIAIFIFILSYIAVYFISKKMTKPILDIERIANKISKFDFSDKVNITSKDEIQKLGESINLMAKELEEKIEELNRANIKLSNELENEKKLEKQRKDFISNVSHELKTPLAIISGYVEGLEDNINEDEKMRYLNTIKSETDRMAKLILKLLNLTKLEIISNYCFEKKDIVPIINENIEKFKILIKNKDIDFKTNFEFEECYLNIDSSKISIVIENFLSNAINYTNEKEKIVVNVKRIEKEDEKNLNKDYFLFEILNSSDKLMVNELKELFTPFFKIEKSRNRKLGGTGLGLAISKTIIELHKGEIESFYVDDMICFRFLLEI